MSKTRYKEVDLRILVILRNSKRSRAGFKSAAFVCRNNIDDAPGSELANASERCLGNVQNNANGVIEKQR